MLIDLPKAKVGDLVLGDNHPKEGRMMFEVERVYRDKNYTWVYVDFEGNEINEMYVDCIWRGKEFKRGKRI